MDEVLVIASALAVQDPRERPIDKQEQADAAHLKFVEETSDFLGYLKLWDWFHANREKLSQSKLRKLCQENFLSYVRLREWRDVHQQLHALVTEMGLHRQHQDAPARDARAHERRAPTGRRRRRAQSTPKPVPQRSGGPDPPTPG
jgi:ATP-dependent helicase HrpA